MKKRKAKKTKSAEDAAFLESFRSADVLARGKLGGRIYSVSKLDKPYTRKARKTRQKSTRARRAARAGLELLNEVWRKLPNEKLALWDLAAHLRIRRKNPEVRSRALIHISAKRISGYNYFMEVNLLARSVGFRGIIDSPPIDEFTGKPLPLPEAPQIKDINFNGQELIIHWSNVEVFSKSCHIRIWLASKEEKFHKQLVESVLAIAGSVLVSRVKGQRGVPVKMIALKGTTLLMQADVVDIATGLASDATNTYLIDLK